MIDNKTLEQIKNKQYLQNKDFSSELHKLIHSFYSGFDLDRQDEDYRKEYVTEFIESHEAFLVNYQTNIYRANLNAKDGLSDELTFNKFLDSLSLYLAKNFKKGEE